MTSFEMPSIKIALKAVLIAIWEMLVFYNIVIKRFQPIVKCLRHYYVFVFIFSIWISDIVPIEKYKFF